MRLVGSEKTGFHLIEQDGRLTQLLQCEACEQWSDEVTHVEEYGGGMCPDCCSEWAVVQLEDEDNSKAYIQYLENRGYWDARQDEERYGY